METITRPIEWALPWRLVKEPRPLSVLVGLSYLTLAFTVGLHTIVNAPSTALAEHVSLTLAATVGVLTLLGGILAAGSLVGGAWFVERTGILFLVGGLIARAVIVWHSPDLGAVVPRMGEIAAILLLLAGRYVRIWGLDLDPTKG